LLGIELEDIASGTATLAVNVRKELTQNQGVVHGGAIASLIDTATAFAIISLLAPREKVTTVDLAISYLRPVMSGRLRAVAKVVRAGRRLFVVSAEVFDKQGRLITTALSTYIKV
jgi:acyl-CoA thioesterase